MYSTLQHAESVLNYNCSHYTKLDMLSIVQIILQIKSDHEAIKCAP